MTMLDSSELDEFISESEELLDEAEKSLLALDNGAEFSHHYDNIFRSFHSLKGAAGMIGFTELQDYMHKAENIFQSKKAIGLNQEELTFFLKCLDEAKLLLHGDTSIIPPELKDSPSTTNKSPSASPATATTPKAIVKEPESTTPEHEPHQNSADGQNTPRSELGLVWVLDDEKELAEIYRDNFIDAGFSAKGFTNPNEVLEDFELHEPDLIVSDFKMPEMTGLDLLQKIRQKNQNIPFILCSGYLDKNILIQALSLGLFAAINKPPEESQLIFLATNAIAQYKSNKLISKLINFLLFQYSELETYFEQNGKINEITSFKTNLKDLIQQRAFITDMNKKVTI